MTDVATLAQRFDLAYAGRLMREQAGRGSLGHVSEMTVTAVARFSSTALPAGFVSGMGGMATGTGPGGETVTAMFGDFVPSTGQRWRLFFNAAGDAWLEDLLRSVTFA